MTLIELQALPLEELMARAKAAVEAMTPAELAHMRHNQTISFVIGNLALSIHGRDPTEIRAEVVKAAGPCPCGVCGAEAIQ